MATLPPTVFITRRYLQICNHFLGARQGQRIIAAKVCSCPHNKVASPNYVFLKKTIETRFLKRSVYHTKSVHTNLLRGLTFNSTEENAFTNLNKLQVEKMTAKYHRFLHYLF